jgi:hypothetical protein
MAKQRLTEDQYLAELNRRLREDEDYEEGMEFLSWPLGATGKGMTGYHMAGRFENYHWVGIYARVAHKVREDCELLI